MVFVTHNTSRDSCKLLTLLSETCLYLSLSSTSYTFFPPLPYIIEDILTSQVHSFSHPSFRQTLLKSSLSSQLFLYLVNHESVVFISRHQDYRDCIYFVLYINFYSHLVPLSMSKPPLHKIPHRA